MDWLPENGGEFANMNPDELVAYMEEANRKAAFALLDKVQDFTQSWKGLREKTLQSRYAVVRSFFLHNRVELPKDPTFIIRPDVMPVKGKLKPEDIRNLALAPNRAYRAMILLMFQTGMGLDEFQHWNLNGLENLQTDLKKNRKYITIELPGRKKMKNKVPYNTYLVPGDAWDALIAYLPYRKLAKAKFEKTQKLNTIQRRKQEERHGTSYTVKEFNPDAIIYSNRGSPLKRKTIQNYWSRKCVKLGIVILKGTNDPRNRYGKNPHEMRDLFATQWNKSPADKVVGEYLMGHTVDPLGYNKACKDVPFVIGEIKKAMSLLNIMTSNKALGLYDEEDVEREREIERVKASKRSKIISESPELSALQDQLDALADMQYQNSSDN